MDTVKYTLPETAIPKSYYNIIADLPTPPPPALHPGTGQPIGPDDLAPLFPMALIMQEVSTEQYIEIPDPVRAIYRQWRPTPLFRARRLEALLDTPAHIYYKYEGVSPVGSHKPNTAVPQAFYNKEEGIKHLSTETGAGQWGSALAYAGQMMGLEVEVFMVKVSYQQKPYRRAMMETFGAKVYASPTTRTQSGSKILEEQPTARGAWASPSVRPWRWRPPMTRSSIRWGAFSTTSSCTRPSSVRRPLSRWSKPATNPTSSLAAPVGAAIFPAWPCRS